MEQQLASDGRTVFETQRLVGRRWMAEDLEDLYEVYSDPEGMRWVGEGIPITRDQCRRWLELTTANYERRGYGMFALVDRASSTVVGFMGLVHPGGQAEPEAKYAFKRSAWGKGYATEALQGMLNHGATQHGLSYIMATVAPQHERSQHVLKKAGMVQTQQRLNEDGSTTLIFSWTPSASAGANP